jgi:NAD(P)-dependent dehydrogenase (short-subunit alcohol dehydrogenase family)
MSHSAFSLKDKRILVTGAGKGIGRCLCRMLGEAGARVLAGDIDALAAADAAEEVSAAGGQGVAAGFDVRDEAGWAAAVASARTAFAGLDGLVNNAGIILMKPLFMTTLDDWRQVNSINVEGVFLGMRTCAPLIAEAGGGSIVNLSSVYGQVGSAGFTAYCASKGAVRMLTKAAALELGKTGTKVRVNSVHPGPIDTDLGVAPLHGMAAAGILPSVDVGREAVRQRYALGRWGEVEDVAGAIMFLLSDASSFITGSELNVDGGWTAD